MFGGIGRVVALLLLPLLAFYLLADSGQVRSSLLRFVPADGRAEVAGIANAIDRALRRYVRGQAIVSLTMGTAVGIALAVMNLPLVLLLAVIVAIAEVVPYLGFVLAAIAIGIAGLSVSPLMALSGVIAYVVINWLIGVFVSPRVMGKYLEMHPFVVTVAVLAGTAILGPVGALLALPGTAALQAAMGEITPATPSGEDESPCPPAPPGSELDPGR
jgi:predicted PurR-regulated permease PerM